MSELPIYEAKSNFTRLVHEAEAGDSFRLTRHGRPAAMLIGVDEYERLRAADGGLPKRLEDWRRRWTLVSGADDDSDPFALLRPRDPGRPVDF